MTRKCWQPQWRHSSPRWSVGGLAEAGGANVGGRAVPLAALMLVAGQALLAVGPRRLQQQARNLLPERRHVDEYVMNVGTRYAAANAQSLVKHLNRRRPLCLA